ncbi:MAG: hypothetical protein Q8L48_28990 [Archangium sp.]|nr:hypothetical protein [Archangium sp.]
MIVIGEPKPYRARVLLSLMVAVALGQAVGEPSSIEDRRAAVRPRFAISAIGGALLFPPGAAVPGFGLMADAGALFNDHFSVGARLSAFTNIVTFDLGVAAALDYALAEHWALGTGVAYKAFGGADSGSLTTALMVPIRVGFGPAIRSAHELFRRGLLIGLEFAGGVVVVDSSGRTFGARTAGTPAFSALLTVGYAQW